MALHVAPAPAALTRALAPAAATAEFAARVTRLVRSGDALLLEGPLGAGKTTFARGFIRAAAGDSALVVPSPSYTLVQSYATRLGPIHHFDLWRLDGPAGLAELGWLEALADIVLVEWPARLGNLAPANALRIWFAITSEEARQVRISGWPDRLDLLR